MYSSKTVITLFIICLLAGACSSSKKAAPKRHPPAISRADVLKGGTSYNSPVVILLQSEREVLNEEYRWLSDNYPGYALVRRTHKIRSPKHYDVVQIRIQQGIVRNIYFDCTKFWGTR